MAKLSSSQRLERLVKMMRENGILYLKFQDAHLGTVELSLDPNIGAENTSTDTETPALRENNPEPTVPSEMDWLHASV